MNVTDTIVAISSAVGAAARVIVRLSGPNAIEIASELVESNLPNCGRATIQVRGMSCPASVYQFHAPHSATGDDVVEFHIPGNVLLARILVEELIARGARAAEAGEFTARAFFNGRIDLARAEGVAATISAQSQAELDAARRLMSGALAKRIEPSMQTLAETLALVEAEIDFSEEPVSFLPVEEAKSRLLRIKADLQILLDDSPRLDRLTHEPQVVLAGRPNAGKSTLLNALAGYERAIVSPLAGTTRDALSAMIHLPRGFARLIDVAGIDAPSNEIEGSMQSQAAQAIESADVLVLVRDCTDSRPELFVDRAIDAVVLSKSDLSVGKCPGMAVSAKTGAGLPEMRKFLDDRCFGQATSTVSESVALNSRHIAAIKSATENVGGAITSLDAGREIIALNLRSALDDLGSILGAVAPDDVIGLIFSKFCIGK